MRCARAGVPPHIAHTYTWREVNILLEADTYRSAERMQLAMTAAHTMAKMSRAKRIPPLGPILRKLNPDAHKPMSARVLRSAIMGINRGMGGAVRTLSPDAFQSVRAGGKIPPG